MHASACVSCISTLNTTALSAGTSKACAMIEVRATGNESCAPPTPEPESSVGLTSVASSMRRREMFSSSVMSANRYTFCETEKMLLPAACVGVHS
eukprot:2187769-Rhodomonas_salina.1